jgi:hypothetical protein
MFLPYKEKIASGVWSALSGKLLFDGKEEMRHNCAGSQPVYDLPYTCFLVRSACVGKEKTGFLLSAGRNIFGVSSFFVLALA